MKIKITAPNKEYSGLIFGLQFKDGVHEGEDKDISKAVKAYFTSAGYKIETVKEPTKETAAQKKAREKAEKEAAAAQEGNTDGEDAGDAGDDKTEGENPLD
ncbi:hypothetical protein [Culicoidibacter larvae]|uniref:Uncharacterized protein n=1 Tax=Culicoidibacter larvae TaxID=2579976 RepID=A0A5R8Q965_9FIRM|nr:hypothetical protein [Culicoidibacter larvae]TLG71379.1 hypothetical protein FEZ08_10820 [Culicoidibacter larvae]